MIGTLEHHPLPSPKRTDREVEEKPPTPPLPFDSDSEEEDETQSTQHWFDQIQQRLGKGDQRTPAVVGKPALPGRPAVPGNRNDPIKIEPDPPTPVASQPSSGEVADASGLSRAPSTLEDIHQLSSAVASSVNIIDHQFKLSVLGRLGALEKQVKELEEKCQRTYDTCKGISEKISWRKGSPCDIIERLDSMTSFTYAFCKGMEDAGIFQLRKFTHTQ